MGFYECGLTDLGFECPHDHEPIADISGLDNRCASDGHPCQCFRHRGVVGGPDVPTSFRDEVPGISVICIAETAPTGATELTEEQFLARLVESYGWPEGTTMGDDGRPHGPSRVVVDETSYQVTSA